MSNKLNKKINCLSNSRNRKLSRLHDTCFDTKYCDYIESINSNGIEDAGYTISMNGLKQYEIDVSSIFRTALKMGKRYGKK